MKSDCKTILEDVSLFVKMVLYDIASTYRRKLRKLITKNQDIYLKVVIYI